MNVARLSSSLPSPGEKTSRARERLAAKLSAVLAEEEWHRLVHSLITQPTTRESVKLVDGDWVQL
eukprot:scaffold781_cov394-Prasinococcus_capsulatus_cf.AAC.13